MFPNIKNKFRFVTVSLLLASLVTVVSGASAEERGLEFEVDVTSCTDGDVIAYWNPGIEPTATDSEVEAGDISGGAVAAYTGFLDGETTCVGPEFDDRLVGGIVTSSITITDVGWSTSSDCPAPGGCPASEALTLINGSYTVPADAVARRYRGFFNLTWTP